MVGCHIFKDKPGVFIDRNIPHVDWLILMSGSPV